MVDSKYVKGDEHMDETMVCCNVKANAELIARILDYDVEWEAIFTIEPDGTLVIDLPAAVENVKRVDLFNSDTHTGSLYYLDDGEL